MTGLQLREALTSLNKTQEDLARDLGVSASTVNRWIRGKRNPNRLTKRAINNQLDLYRVELSTLQPDKPTEEAI